MPESLPRQLPVSSTNGRGGLPLSNLRDFVEHWQNVTVLRGSMQQPDARGMGFGLLAKYLRGPAEITSRPINFGKAAERTGPDSMALLLPAPSSASLELRT
jgi:hypothetical protein